MNFCKERGLYDIPNQRKVHKNPIPRLGGICFMPSMLVAFIVAILVLASEAEAHRIAINLWSVSFLGSLLFIYAIGIIDDLIGLKANLKFIVQIIAATILPLSGLYINNLYGLFGIYEIPFWIGGPFTVFAIVFINNAFNLIDGIDGLCASLSFLALGGFLYTFFREGLYAYCVLIAGLMGVLIPYLYFNMFGKAEKNRKIFMGDSGSLTLGFILGFLFVKLTMDNPRVMEFCPDRMYIAMSLLMIPVFDVVRVILYRLRNHQGIFTPDKKHIHHKVMATGLNQHQALTVILLLSVFFTGINAIIYRIADTTIMLLADVAIYTAFNLCLNYLINKKEASK